MSPSYQFELASEQDDCALRNIMRNTFMPGEISLSFQREPSFFAAERAGNLDTQVIAVRDTANGAIVGLGCRSFRKMFINGNVAVGGYLSGLRGLPEVRGGTLLARGYRFLKGLHADGRTPYYVTTIFEDNDQARELLASRRAGLPVYHPLGRLHTYLMPLYGWRRWPCQPDKVIRGMSGDLLGPAVESLNNFNRRHQFAPWYTLEDFQGTTRLLPGFALDNLYGWWDGSHVTATLGVWDQTPFKQSVATSYSWRYRLARPICAAGAPFGLTPKLPRIGRPVPYLYGAFLSYSPGYEAYLESLLCTAMKDWSGLGYAYLVAGAHENNPVDRLLQRYAISQRSSTLYLVYWEDMLECPLPSFELIPHLEIATL